MELWLPLAERGDAEAQFAIGTLYYSGIGVPLDHTESTYWFHRAAEQGYAYAQYNLGNAYKRGEGVRVNHEMAVYWWEKAAEQGLAAAVFNLATAYRNGEGIAADPARALALYSQAADSGHPRAREILRDWQAAPPETVEPNETTEATETMDTAGTAATPASHAAAVEPPACGAWLSQHDHMAYTLQLMSTTVRADVVEAARQHGLRDYAICAYHHEGSTRYALLNGSYPSVAAAKQGITELTDSLRAANPWIRRIKSVADIAI